MSNFIIFPEISVPLNIFEKRYLQMVDDSMKTNRLILIDGSAYIFRAYYALPPMQRKDGTPVNAVFGLLPLFFLGNMSWFVLIVNLLIGLATLLYFKKRLGGVTGDSLGATQQILEVVFYLCFGFNFII